MQYDDLARAARRAGWAAAIAGLIAAPAVAFGAAGFGGFHGGFRGGFHGGFHSSGRVVGTRPAPPAIDARPATPPFVTAPPPVRVRVGFVRVRPSDFVRVRPSDFFRLKGDMRRKDRFRRRLVLPWAFGGGGWFGSYAVGPGEAYAQGPAAEPETCPELLTWSPRLGHAIRRELCDEGPSPIAFESPPPRMIPRG